ncbi:hypothetical protein EN800_01945 [bacterium M00.F.Ca.ET.157.01.1.1]|uniref:hypothetical protein n=1 Tax=Mesorhizobium sp. M2D.F.Ca.ET.223.01.1.1 TaxID=2563940 RepID=UPI001091B927|nr:hypothetical protein [Mesorhizobium sp. M2D.F.Ca.ET.223.01.1.1]TGT89095.1 hypothetical protein EN800_01945 [bacterium M00.F.Ca.ET.157.01.1.1]
MLIAVVGDGKAAAKETNVRELEMLIVCVKIPLAAATTAAAVVQIAATMCVDFSVRFGRNRSHRREFPTVPALGGNLSS